MKIFGHNHRAGVLPLLTLSFGLASGMFGRSTPAQAPATPPVVTQTSHSYWKHPDYDAVIEVWTDPAKGLRGKLVSLNPADEKIRKMVGKVLKKDEARVSTSDVLSFVGMEGDLHLHKEGDKWTGSIYWPYKEKSYGVDVEPLSGKLHVHGFLLMLPFIGKSVDLLPAPPPKPAVLATR